MSKHKIKTSSMNAWRSLCWWPDLSDCLVTSSISQGRPYKKPADYNCWDDGEARREDLSWQSKDVGNVLTLLIGEVSHWRQWSELLQRPMIQSSVNCRYCFAKFYERMSRACVVTTSAYSPQLKSGRVYECRRLWSDLYFL